MAIIYTDPEMIAYLYAVKELEQKRRELTAMQERIAGLHMLVLLLAPIAIFKNQVAPVFCQSLTDLCCAVLGANPGKHMTVPEIRQAIELTGINLRYSNPLAVLHTTLRRLSNKPNSPVKLTPPDPVSAGDTSASTAGGSRKFFWDASVPPPSAVLQSAKEM